MTMKTQSFYKTRVIIKTQFIIIYNSNKIENEKYMKNKLKLYNYNKIKRFKVIKSSILWL